MHSDYAAFIMVIHIHTYTLFRLLPMKHTTQYVIPLTSIIFVIFVNRYNIIPLSPFFIRSSVYFPFAGCRSSQKKEKEKEKETSEPVHL